MLGNAKMVEKENQMLVNFFLTYRLNYLRKALDKLLVEVYKAKKLL